MEETYDMKDVLKLKLRELEYEKKFMQMDKKFTKEDIDEINKMIQYIKKEYAKELSKEAKVARHL